MAVVARRYAEALINTALESGSIVKYEEQLDVLKEIVSMGNLEEILEYPGINVSKKKELINAVLGSKVDEDIVNFFMLLLDNGRHKYLNDIVCEYKEMTDQYKNILNVEITSAIELENDYIEKIKEKVAVRYSINQINNIRVKEIVDASVIGGIKLKIGDTVIDGTVKSTLEGIKRVIKQNSIL